MFPDLTIYTVSADLSLLQAILNGVAMISNQTAYIFGFAVLVSIWNIVRTLTKSALALPGGGAGAVMGTGTMDIFVPLILAFLLATPGFKTSIQLESTINGKVAKVDNVPIVIGLVPAAASQLSQNLGALVGTAYQNVGTDYASISASGTGFANALKLLLTSRTAILRLGSIDSQVRSVVGACINTDSGADFSTVINKVVNAGNSGAGLAQTIEIRGIPKTAVGALLYQASLNTTGLVTDLNVNGQTILTCADAATLVADNITTALDSQEFKRVIQGAVNGMDNPTPNADFSFDRIAQQYAAVRTANTALSTLADGTTQAYAETINLMFSELVSTSLNCLRSDATNRTVCQAAAIQALEVERNNIQRAANEVPMLKYAGSFANQIMALIIGLGPIIVLFMMFSGANSGKSVYTAVHIIVWPLLVLNVGAELVNGMIYVQVANFLASIAQGGYLSQAVAIEAYKHFSLQVGTASHIMASLPVLMSMIFALGASSAMVSVANRMNPPDSQAAPASTPQLQNTAPILQNSSMATAVQGSGFNVTSESGAVKAVAQNATYGQLAQQVFRSQSEERARQEVIAEGESLTHAFTERGSLSKATRHGIDESTAKSISDRATESLRKANGEHVNDTATSLKSNSNSTTLGAGASASASTNKGAGLGASLRGDTATTATDTMNRTTSAGKTKSIEEAKAVEKAISDELREAKTSGRSTDAVKALEAMYSKQQQYTSSLSETTSSKDGSGVTDQNSNQLVSFAQSYSSESLAHAVATNPAMRDFQLTEGRSFESNPAVARHMHDAAQMVESGASEQVRGSPLARQAAIRHNAAVRLLNDTDATADAKKSAADYLVNQGMAVTGLRQSFGGTDRLRVNLGRPEDATGVDGRDLEKRTDKLIPSMPAAKPTHRAGARSTTAAPSPGGAATTTPTGQNTAVLPEVRDAFNKTDAAGLNQESTKGTVRRAGENAVGNIANTFAGGRNERVSLGRLDSE